MRSYRSVSVQVTCILQQHYMPLVLWAAVWGNAPLWCMSQPHQAVCRSGMRSASGCLGGNVHKT